MLVQSPELNVLSQGERGRAYFHRPKREGQTRASEEVSLTATHSCQGSSVPDSMLARECRKADTWAAEHQVWRPHHTARAQSRYLRASPSRGDPVEATHQLVLGQPGASCFFAGCDSSGPLSLSRSQMLLLSSFGQPRPLGGSGRPSRAAPVSGHARRFADGELFVKIDENVRGRDVFIIQPTNPPAENMMELLLMMDAAHAPARHASRRSCRTSGTRDRTARTSRASRSAPSWWRT